MSTNIGWVDKFGFYHDKEVVFEEPSSNNPAIYTAYAKALGFPVDINKVGDNLCEMWEYRDFWIMDRLPGKRRPPTSRDELIGWFSLGFQGFVRRIANNGWTWLNHYPDLYEEYSLLDTIKAFWRARNEHRNYLWLNEELAAYPLMFSFRPHDRYYFKTYLGYKTTMLEDISWLIYKHWTNWKGSSSEKNILWLQCLDIKDNFIKKIHRDKNFLDYFGPNHIFNIEIKNNL